MGIICFLQLSGGEGKNTDCNKAAPGNTYHSLGYNYLNLNGLGCFESDLKIDARDRERKAMEYNQLGCVYFSRGDFKTAAEFYQQAIMSAKEVGNKEIQGKAYTNIGSAYSFLGDFKTAIKFHQQAIIIAKEVGNKDSEGKAYMSLGLAYGSLGYYKTAIEFHKQALSIANKIGNKDAEGLQRMNLGNVYHSLSDFKQAIEFYHQALKIANEVGNKDSEEKAYRGLGISCHSLGDFKAAIGFHQQALSIAKEVGNKDSEGKAYSSLGISYHSLGDFKAAIEFHHQALSIAKEVGNKDLEERAYRGLGLAYDSLGDFKAAIEFHQQALRIAKEIGNKGSEGNAYDNLGMAYRSLGDFKTAIEFHQEALSIFKKVGDKNSEGAAYGNLGAAYLALGDFKVAIDFHQQALGIAKEVGNKDAEGKAHSVLGIAYRSLGDFQTAIGFHHRALGIAKEVGNKDSEGMAYGNLGRAYQSLGEFKTAIAFFQQALSIAKETGNIETEGGAIVNLGIAYLSLGDLIKATEFNQQALNIAKNSKNKDLEGKVYNNLGIAYYLLGDFCRAEDFFKSGVNLFDEMRNLLQSNDGWKIDLRNQYTSCYNFLWLAQLKQSKTVEALLTAERGRAQALMDLMESQYGVKSAQSTPEEETESASRISSHIPSLAIFIAEYFGFVHFWVLEKDQQCQFVQKAINCSLHSLTDRTYEQIGVFEPVMCENRSLDAEATDERSEKLFDRSPHKKGMTSSGSDAWKLLSDVVIGPISHLIQGDELIIVPDGPLFLVPYAALVDQHSRFLSETLRIRLVPSLTSLKLMAECPEEYHCTSGALLVGDPWVEGVRINGRAVQQLSSAKEEVELIGKILKIEPLTGRNATKAKVLSKLNSVALVHIAAHGRAETGEILLSRKEEEPKEEDVVLTMADVLNAKLRARLVVLSCCHSGRGKIKAEGVVGIARAFLGAGARSVLVSLWAIDDEATLEFMRKFYEHLMEGQSASKSLNQAMKWMRKSVDFSKVRYWAPFVLIGDDVTLNFG